MENNRRELSRDFRPRYLICREQVKKPLIEKRNDGFRRSRRGKTRDNHRQMPRVSARVAPKYRECLSGCFAHMRLQSKCKLSGVPPSKTIIPYPSVRIFSLI